MYRSNILQVKIWSQLVPPKSLIATYQTAPCHTPENHNMILRHCENLKNYDEIVHIFKLLSSVT
jgi:hypothetical protein